LPPARYSERAGSSHSSNQVVAVAGVNKFGWHVADGKRPDLQLSTKRVGQNELPKWAKFIAKRTSVLDDFIRSRA